MQTRLAILVVLAASTPAQAQPGAGGAVIIDGMDCAPWGVTRDTTLEFFRIEVFNTPLHMWALAVSRKNELYARSKSKGCPGANAPRAPRCTSRAAARRYLNSSGSDIWIHVSGVVHIEWRQYRASAAVARSRAGAAPLQRRQAEEGPA